MKNIEKLDTVTGLPIYDSFIGIAREELANNFVPGHYVLIATDISNFKYINNITEIRRHFAAVWTATAGILLKIITENILRLCFTLTMVYFLLMNIMMI